MASLIKRGDIWYVQFKMDDKWERVSCKTSVKRIAQEILNKYKVAEAEGGNDLITRKKKSITLGEFLKKHLNQAKSVNAPSWFEIKSIYFQAHIVPFFGENKFLKDITLSQIEEYRVYRLNKVSSRSVNHEVSVLISLMRQAVDWGDLEPKYLPKVKKLKQDDKRLRFLTTEEIDRLFDEAKKFDEDMECYIRLMLYAGLRLGEALNLRWVDIDLEKKLVVIAPREDWKPKTRRGRIVPIPPELLDYLVNRRLKYPDASLVVLGAGHYTIERMERIFRKIAAQAGLETKGEDKVTAHTLRHTYASHLVMNGTPLYTVSALLGHSDSKTTQIYAHLAPDHLKEAVENGIRY